MLIASPRHTPEDLDAWGKWVRQVTHHQLVHRRTLDRRVQTSLEAIRSFGGDWCGVSWGKDSVVTAHLVRRACPDTPVCWVRSVPGDTSDCDLVRDAFLAAWPGPYSEYETATYPSPEGLFYGPNKDTEWYGDWPPAKDFGPRYISGLRMEESTSRRLRGLRWGESTQRTCAPLMRWRTIEVFAYLLQHDLPIHPAYACLHGGLSPDRVRVAPIGGLLGGRPRRQWERFYYQAELDAIGIE